MFKKKFQVIGLGGTFDHFHAGHRHFIQFAFSLAEKLAIGITNEKLTKHKPFATTIEPYEVRYHNVKSYCRRHHIPCELVELTDVFGPTLESTSIQALCVTDETVAGASKINDMRQKMGLWEFPVYICDYFKDETGQPLHAERVRAGIVSRQGTVYRELLNHDLQLNDRQRAYFSQPQGEVIDLAHHPKHSQHLRYVVGDNSLETFIAHGWKFDMGVFDHRRLRQPFSSATIQTLIPTTKITNPPGSISQALVIALQSHLYQSGSLIEVDGEEDLAAVALILLAPLESEVYYGQPDKGIICMKVTEDLKEEAYQVLR